MTLERMFPGRPFLGHRLRRGAQRGAGRRRLAVGRATRSPAWTRRSAIIRRLWDGETITEEGRFYRLKDCKLHTLADRRPPIWVSAFGPQAAEVAGRHGDGLWTLPDPESTPEMIDAYREARAKAAGATARSSSRRSFSWAPSDDEALEQARKWKGAQPQEHFTDDWHEPREMYEHGEARDVRRGVRAEHHRRSDPAENRSACASSRSSARP